MDNKFASKIILSEVKERFDNIKKAEKQGGHPGVLVQAYIDSAADVPFLLNQIVLLQRERDKHKMCWEKDLNHFPHETEKKQ